VHLTLSRDVVERVLPGTKSAPLSLPWSVEDQDPQVGALMNALAAEASGGYQSGALFGEGLVSALVARLAAKYGYAEELRIQSGLTRRQLLNIRNFIQENLHTNLTITTLAEVAGYSPWHFQRMFRETTGQSVHRYVMSARIEHAKTLMRRTNLSVTEVAFACGFSNASHLAKHFRLQLGCTPIEYRAKT